MPWTSCKRWSPLIAVCTFITLANFKIKIITTEHSTMEPSEFSSSYLQQRTSLDDDYHKLINLTDFNFQLLVNCSQEEGPLVVVVHSAPTRAGHRSAIRASWGSSHVKVVFMLGAVTNETLQRSLEDEGRQHGDLVQGSFYDTYRNLTYKHVMAFKWLNYHCRGPKFILKTDDDIFLNLPSVSELIRNDSFPSDHIICHYNLMNRPSRSWRNKWRVSPLEYKDTFYPHYCNGWLVLYSNKTAKKLYTLAQQEPYFWIDDLLITGFLAKKAGLHHFSTRPWLLDWQMSEDIIRNGSCPYDKDCKKFIFGPSELDPEQIVLLWKILAISNNTGDDT
ncbi:beta-1,3-galactosyltransferase 5-like [Neocloeon triangulifer]|uniref:beta-1,3-galactosyltransferase 5-like n=1 Tax=Neocloeon triangulifer TaxID=2078957 RepID=UPI00286F687B|nr:beta-1,3-galactosyltransferase 5-like [Neocloeon triangulifer]